MDSKNKSGTITIIITIVIAFILAFATFGDSNKGGDGKSTCRNCGRQKKLSSAGYCSTCQKGYDEWLDEYYKNN